MRRARILSRKPGPRTRLSQDWMPSEKTTLILRCLLQNCMAEASGIPLPDSVSECVDQYQDMETSLH
ncbi:hypothetical protein GBAR_LOCUS15585 [Geodia barretti]|uniref:Uncharacterized protein n=1 Tax=Geodia barretti TaxID=519541 RepID=A0AA35SEP4_GEOBA|nr:hypothetical protein GBAR_LOCUS15585 [Geodia barretti]